VMITVSPRSTSSSNWAKRALASEACIWRIRFDRSIKPVQCRGNLGLLSSRFAGGHVGGAKLCPPAAFGAFRTIRAATTRKPAKSPGRVTLISLRCRTHTPGDARFFTPSLDWVVLLSKLTDHFDERAGPSVAAQRCALRPEAVSCTMPVGRDAPMGTAADCLSLQLSHQEDKP
jgi:hypothetical protein